MNRSLKARCRRLFGAVVALSTTVGAVQTAFAANWYPTDGTEFQQHLDSSALGDTIILNAGSTYTGSFTLPNKTSGSGWITIQSSALGSLPASGTRVTLANASNMPKIIPGNSTSSAIQTAVSAHHFKLIGLEIISFTSSSTITNDLVALGDGSLAQNSLSMVPNNIVIDRCIIRASTATQRIKRGVALNSASTDILDSHLSGFKVDGQDSQAINGWNGPGPFNIINNYLEGAAENVMFGGATVGIANLVPSDIVIKRNHFYKPQTWNKNRTTANGFSAPLWDGINWTVKNLLEFKAGRRILVEGNVFDNHWIQAQPGWSLVYTPRGQSGQAPWVVVEDIDFLKNIVRNVSAGPNIMGRDDSAPTEQTKRIKFLDNLWYNVGGTEFGGGGKLFQTLGDIDQLTLNHNTAFQTSNILSASGLQSTGCVFVNNLFPHNSYGFFGGSVGNGCLNNYFSGPSGVVFTKNVLMGGNATNYNQYANNFSPTSLGFPTSWSGVLVNQASPGTNFAGWKVVASSAYDNSGLTPALVADGRDVGCDIDAVNAATAGCVSGVWPTALVAQDSFDYSGTLNGQTGGVGFGANAWTAVSGQANPVVATGSMTYGDGAHTILTAGNKLQPANTSRSTRNFASTLATANKTYWVSFRINQTGTGTLPTNHAGFSLFSGTNGSGTEIFMGKPGSAANWGIDHSGTMVQKSGTLTRDAFLVYKLAFTSSNVTISMWVNPILSEGSLLATPDATVTKAHTSTIASMRISTGSNAVNYQFDEFRMGTGFQDVTD